jgi:hypothetical protein
MSDDLEAPPRGRLFVVTGSPGSPRTDVARALAERLGECLLVDGDAVEAMVVGRRPGLPGGSARLRRQLLRWSACLAVAETYQLDGVDAVVTDELLDEAVETFLDLASPEPVHLVVVATAGTEPGTPHWGLWLDPASATVATDAADTVLEHLDECLVMTA